MVIGEKVGALGDADAGLCGAGDVDRDVDLDERRDVGGDTRRMFCCGDMAGTGDARWEVCCVDVDGDRRCHWGRMSGGVLRRSR